MPVNNYKILIVDDDPSFRAQVAFGLRKHYEFESAPDTTTLWQKLNAANADYDLILLDLALDASNDVNVGLDLIKPIQQLRADIPIVVATNRPDYKSSVIAMKNGAKDFFAKNEWDSDLWDMKLRAVIEKQSLEEEIKEIKARTEYENPPNYPLLGISPQMEHLRKTLKAVADMPKMTALITGETGVGKGVAARFLHHNSRTRRDGPFEEIHITHYGDDVLAGLLFGAKKGAYTDAKTDIKGRLHMADKGVVFLDEIGDLGERSQSMLLQFLNSKTIRPLGGDKDIPLDVQIVAATNKNLRQEIAEGRFRLDLFQRLKVQPIEIAPLRERREDIWVLLRHFFAMSDRELRNLLEPEVVRLLEDYHWEGNVRELENTVQSMVLQQQVFELPRITPKCLPKEILKPASTSLLVVEPRLAVSVNSDRKMSLDEENARNTLTHYERALKDNNGRKAPTAQALGTTGDLMLYNLKQFHKRYPGILDDFPTIIKYYKTVRH
jgi:DNA-binding NtrC family response regulator